MPRMEEALLPIKSTVLIRLSKRVVLLSVFLPLLQKKKKKWDDVSQVATTWRVALKDSKPASQDVVWVPQISSLQLNSLPLKETPQEAKGAHSLRLIPNVLVSKFQSPSSSCSLPGQPSGFHKTPDEPVSPALGLPWEPHYTNEKIEFFKK